MQLMAASSLTVPVSATNRAKTPAVLLSDGAQTADGVPTVALQVASIPSPTPPAGTCCTMWWRRQSHHPTSLTDHFICAPVVVVPATARAMVPKSQLALTLALYSTATCGTTT
eukprot:EG_transcript_45470